MIQPFFHHEPTVPSTAFVHPDATVVGHVVLGERCSVWPGVVMRGDINSITMGDCSNVQDDSVMHVGDDHPVLVGSEVVVGHAVRLHGCTVANRCLIGIGAVVLNGAAIEEECILAAGTLVPENMRLAAGHLYMGVPARQKRALSGEEIRSIRRMAHKYTYVAEAHRRNFAALARGERLDKRAWDELLAEMAAVLAKI